MGLKSRNEYQLVESAKGTVEDREIVEKLKRNFAEFIVEEDQYEERRSTNQVIGFINNDIGKKLTLYVEIIKYGGLDFFIKITNL
ncbi:hypothetical protein DdX_21166 [Ditylenchus destructor]|uniref:Uncharacterized protein n=1 Tax=Ditylenchus destructor TaxID=166010 RepID=A0AAD4MK42_9BILA|nr:hypothetical protein DdX_21166 [Ditylenchus destructor]